MSISVASKTRKVTKNVAERNGGSCASSSRSSITSRDDARREVLHGAAGGRTGGADGRSDSAGHDGGCRKGRMGQNIQKRGHGNRGSSINGQRAENIGDVASPEKHRRATPPHERPTALTNLKTWAVSPYVSKVSRCTLDRKMSLSGVLKGCVFVRYRSGGSPNFIP